MKNLRKVQKWYAKSSKMGVLEYPARIKTLNWGDKPAKLIDYIHALRASTCALKVLQIVSL